MGKSSIAIVSEALPELVPILMQFVAVTGSSYSRNGVVVFEIEGECVPNTPRVIGNITKQTSRSGGSFSIRFDRDLNTISQESMNGQAPH